MSATSDEHIIHADDVAINLKAQAIRGGAVSLLTQGLLFAMQVALAILLARLLTPADFGLFGIAFAVTSFIALFKDGGMILSVVQSRTLTGAQLNSLFWFNAALGFLLFAFTLLVAPLVGWLYGDMRLCWTMFALAFICLFGGLSTQQRAFMRRSMRFTALAVCEAFTFLVSSVVTVIAAWYWKSFWALVLFPVLLEFSQAVFLFFISGWLPGKPERGSGIRSILGFGGYLTAFDLLNYLTHEVDNLLIGWFLGPAVLGFYDRAYKFLLLPVKQIVLPMERVVQATLSRLQTEAARFCEYVSRCVLLTTSLGMPLILFLAGVADVLIPFVFGEQWRPSAVLFQALAPAAFLLAITTCVNWIFVSLGRARRQLRWGVFTTLVTVTGFLIGLRWGAFGVALAFSLCNVLLFIPTLMYTCDGTPVDWTDIIKAAWRPASASLLALVVIKARQFLITAFDPLLYLACDAVIYSLVYTGVWLLLPNGRRIIGEHLRLIKDLRRD